MFCHFMAEDRRHAHSPTPALDAALGRTISWRDGRKEWDETFKHGRMGKDGIPQCGIREFAQHGDLDGRDNLSCLHA